MTVTTEAHAPRTSKGLALPDAAAAEWLKLRSVRSTQVVLGVVLVFLLLGVLLAWQTTAIWDGLSPERRTRFAFTGPAALVSWAAALCLGVLGVLQVTSEYRTGMIRTTLAVMPRRPAILAAKAGVLAALALAVGNAVTLASFFTERLIVGDRPIPGHRTAVAQELPELLARGSMVVVYALLGLGLAALLRSTAGAIVGLVLPWYMLPIFTGFLPAPWDKRVSSFMPDALPEQIVGGGNTHSVYGDLLPPVAAVAVAVAYAVLPVCAAAFVLNRRDA
ncbi:ABC transporter permease [Actinomadura rugatobispora]|uniref:ABC transporter permease n=1 Tax=Actinomadura rugatobispora TaxID=1994 RepID=A0ABW1AHT2_9ACTN|nr:ABC transporter permease [Actinomadura rugatobispora]